MSIHDTHYDVDGDKIVVESSYREDADVWIEIPDRQGVALTRDVAADLVISIAQAAGMNLPQRTASPAELHGATENDEREGWNLDALTAAVEYGRVAEFSYEKEQSPRTIERRVLKPERIFTTAAGKLCVIGEDQERDDTRVFRIDRIVGHVTVR